VKVGTLRTLAPWHRLTSLLLAAAAKALLLFVVLPGHSQQLKPLYQMRFVDDYDKLAASIAAGRGYRLTPDGEPTLMREPGYPFLLALVFRVLGPELGAARAANLVLGLVTAVVVLVLAADIGLPSGGALLAAILFMLHPGTVVAESRGGFESLFTLLLAVFVLVLGRAFRGQRVGAYAVAGLVLGLAGLVRTTVILLPAAVFAWLLVSRPRRLLGDSLVKTVVLGACMLGVLLPWIVRNSLLTGTPTWAPTVRGTAAHAGQYACLHRGDPRGLAAVDSEAARERARLAREWGYRFHFDYYLYFPTTRDEVEFDRRLQGMVVRRWAETPSLLLRCAAGNLAYFWVAGRTGSSVRLNVAAQVPYLVLAVLGAAVLARRGQAPALAPMGLVVAYVVLLHSVVAAQARYSVPLVPFLAVCAAVPLSELAALLRRQRASARAA
jgi:hypothetical protein